MSMRGRKCWNISTRPVTHNPRLMLRYVQYYQVKLLLTSETEECSTQKQMEEVPTAYIKLQ